MSDRPPFENLVHDLPPADTTTLRAIVKRRDRWVRSVSLSLLAVGLLAGAGLTTYLRPQALARPAQVLAAPVSPKSQGGSDSDVAAGTGITPLTGLLSRQMGDDSINLFALQPQPGSAQCMQAELSTHDIATSVVGQTDVVEPNNVTVVISDIVGIAEGKPTALVVAKVGRNIRSVVMHFTDGSTDKMASDNGWVVFARSIDPNASTVGTLEATDSSAKIVVRSQLPNVAPPSCVTPGR